MLKPFALLFPTGYRFYELYCLLQETDHFVAKITFCLVLKFNLLKIHCRREKTTQLLLLNCKNHPQSPIKPARTFMTALSETISESEACSPATQECNMFNVPFQKHYCTFEMKRHKRFYRLLKGALVNFMSNPPTEKRSIKPLWIPMTSHTAEICCASAESGIQISPCRPLKL